MHEGRKSLRALFDLFETLLVFLALDIDLLLQFTLQRLPSLEQITQLGGVHDESQMKHLDASSGCSWCGNARLLFASAEGSQI